MFQCAVEQTGGGEGADSATARAAECKAQQNEHFMWEKKGIPRSINFKLSVIHGNGPEASVTTNERCVYILEKLRYNFLCFSGVIPQLYTHKI
jgi:hypothetical protein